MKLKISESEDRFSRRQFLKGFLPKSNGMVFIDKEKCTGCALCAIDCPNKALALRPNHERDSFQLLFRQETCTACGECERSCPEHCLRFIQREPEKNESRKETEVLFEDHLSRCIHCGIPLFPRSMVKRLEGKILTDKGSTWELDLCPSCRIKASLILHPSLSPAGRGRGGFQFEE